MVNPFEDRDTTEPTPASRAASLKARITNENDYDDYDAEFCLVDLLTDMMHLIDVEKCGEFDALCEQARKRYTAEVDAQEEAQDNDKL